MPFFEKMIEGLGGAIGGSLLGASNARTGARIDTRAKLGQEQKLWERAQSRGLTPQEYYGSPAPGNPSSSGAAQVIGNQANQMTSQAMQLGTQVRENEKDRQNALRIEEIRAGVQERGQDLQFETALRSYNLQATQYFETTVPQIAANIKKTEQETAVLINDAITSTPKFVEMMKLLSMGPDNVYVAAVLEAAGVKTIDDIGNLPKAEQQKILAQMLTGKSTIAREAAGFTGQIDDFVDSIIDTAVSLLPGSGPGIEPADGSPKPSTQQKHRRGQFGRRQSNQ